jgi:hypothetical protein
MEILEINSSHNLMNSILDKRPVGANTYKISCRQFMTVYRTWLKDGAAREHSFGVMTLGFERIWISKDEGTQVAAAIQEMRSPLTIG